ncbi:MAG: hypothetical protein ABII68_06175 [Pseudomonadota bacterium]
MECPKCGFLNSQVIDSRLGRDGISIRRRRRCLSCSLRFTTFEATEDRLLPILLQKKAGHGATLPKFKTTLLFLSDAIKVMSEETRQLTRKVAEFEKAHVSRKSTSKVLAGTPSKRKAVSKKTVASKTKGPSATDRVLKVIKRHKKGVDCSKLKEKTGFDDKKIRGILYLATKRGKIKRTGRGIYVNA